jgi:hypothetical protein
MPWVSMDFFSMANSTRGLHPVTDSTIWPSRRSITVGTLRTLKAWVNSGASSTSTYSTCIKVLATFSKCGLSALHGPHQDAEKTKTQSGVSSIARWHDSAVFRTCIVEFYFEEHSFKKKRQCFDVV